MKEWVCSVCGYVHTGDEAPDQCPQCKVSKDKFNEKAAFAGWADEHKIGVAQGLDAEVVQGLRDNYMGECTEVGMYLAMSRQADREGYPEIAEAFKRYALEEAEHAAKLLKNLQSVILNLEQLQKVELAKENLCLQNEQKNLDTMLFMIQFTKWQKTKLVTALDLWAC